MDLQLKREDVLELHQQHRIHKAKQDLEHASCAQDCMPYLVSRFPQKQHHHLSTDVPPGIPLVRLHCNPYRMYLITKKETSQWDNEILKQLCAIFSRF